MLSSKAERFIFDGKRKGEIIISIFSVWELCMLVQKQRIELTLDTDEWIAKSEQLPFIHFVPVDKKVLVQSVFLPDYPHKDPADRIILATAMQSGATLITKDKHLQQYKHVKTVW